MAILNYILIAAALAILFSGIRIVRPTHSAVVETLGKFSKIIDSGFTWIIPVIQRTYYVNITEQMVDTQPQMVITKDNLNAEVDAVIYYKVKDVKASIYNIDDHRAQLSSLARTTLRAVIGKMSFTQANENRNRINADVEEILDAETKTYGVDVLRVEIQKIEAPEDVQTAMNAVVKAERIKIASKDEAEAVKIKASGEKEAEIQKAEGQRQSSILIAEGQAQAFELIEKSFKQKAQLLKQLEVTQKSLENNAKIVLTEKGITPKIIMDGIPVKNLK